MCNDTSGYGQFSSRHFAINLANERQNFVHNLVCQYTYAHEVTMRYLLNSLDIPAVAEVNINQHDIVVLLTQDNQYVMLGSVQQMPGVQVQLTSQTIRDGNGGEPGEVPEPRPCCCCSEPELSGC